MVTGRRATTAALISALFVLTAAACSGDDGSATATTTTSEVPVETTTTVEVPIEGGEIIYMYEPEIGDCFDLRHLDPATNANNSQLDIVLKLDCNQPHRYEVFDVLSHSNAFDVYPGEQALQSFSDQNCTRAFDGYVGQTYELSAIEVAYWTTAESEWDPGPQPFACTLYDPTADLTSGSLAGSAR